MGKNKRKFVIIAKVDQYIFVKYRSNNLDNFINKFLKVKYPDVRYANVYAGKGVNIGQLMFTWGRHKGLQQAK